jgi:hypothetical protein
VADKRAAFWQSLQGRTMTVIPEDGNHGVNEFYVECQVDASPLAPRQPVLVRAVGINPTGLTVRPVDRQPNDHVLETP